MSEYDSHCGVFVADQGFSVPLLFSSFCFRLHFGLSHCTIFCGFTYLLHLNQQWSSLVSLIPITCPSMLEVINSVGMCPGTANVSLKGAHFEITQLSFAGLTYSSPLFLLFFILKFLNLYVSPSFTLWISSSQRTILTDPFGQPIVHPPCLRQSGILTFWGCWRPMSFPFTVISWCSEIVVRLERIHLWLLTDQQ